MLNWVIPLSLKILIIMYQADIICCDALLQDLLSFLKCIGICLKYWNISFFHKFLYIFTMSKDLESLKNTRAMLYFHAYKYM